MKRIISAGVIVFRRTKEGIKFLILYHGGGYWNFPKGKIEGEERSWQAALREVREETGLKSTELRFLENFKTKEQFSYFHGKERIFKIVILFLAETRQPRIVVSHEHEGYGWFSYNEAKKVLSKYKDSVRILDNAHAFLQRASHERRRPHPARPHAHVPRSSHPSGFSAGLPGGGKHPSPQS